MKLKYYLLLSLQILGFTNSFAQLGQGWVEYTPAKKIHFERFREKHPTALDWVDSASFGDPVIASYKYDPKTETETFSLYGSVANRSEIRLFNDYATGSRQFEGFVTIYPPLDNESLMQIWGSDEGASQLMLRGYAEKNGCIGINHKGGTPKFLSNCYGREIKVNVIHLQEDAGNKIIVYFNDIKTLEFPDNEIPTNYNGNYQKYGCYGTVFPGHESPTVKWRRVRLYKDGTAPDNQ